MLIILGDSGQTPPAAPKFGQGLPFGSWAQYVRRLVVLSYDDFFSVPELRDALRQLRRNSFNGEGPGNRSPSCTRYRGRSELYDLVKRESRIWRVRSRSLNFRLIPLTTSTSGLLLCVTSISFRLSSTSSCRYRPVGAASRLTRIVWLSLTKQALFTIF